MKKYSITTIKLFLSVFIVLVGVFFINTIQAHAADYPEDFPFKADNKFNLSCNWGSTARIKCTDNGGARGVGFDSTYWFDIESTAGAGHIVFKADTKLSFHGYLHLNDVVYAGNITDSPTDGIGGYYVKPVKNDAKFIDGNSEDSNICAVNNLVVGCTNGFDRATKMQDNAAIEKAKVVVQEQKERVEALNACDNSNAPLPFIFCPILNGIQGAIGGLIGGSGQVTEARQGLLISFLSLPPIETRKSDAPLSIVMGYVVNIANSLYIIIFILLIFSGSIPFLNLDSYTIKKTLPKFIGAIILTQFALPICSFIVDFFNLIALAIPNVLFALVQGLDLATPETASTASKVVGGVGGTLAAGGVVGGGIVAVATIGWPLILILAIFALIAAIVAIGYLLIRYFILYVLIILSPLAFACWVLPGTEKFFKMWWKNFIKLNAMFVTIMALLSGSIVISSIISRLPGAANGALIAAVIPIIALLLVPKTLKWTTQGMNAIATGALGAVTGAGSKAAKANTSYGKKRMNEGIEEKRNELADVDTKFGRTVSGGVGGFFNTKNSQRQRAGRAAKYAKERNAEVEFEYNKSNGKLTSDLLAIDASNDTDAEKKVNSKKAPLRSAMELVKNIGSDAASRQALMVTAAQSGDTTTLRALQSVMTAQEWGAGVANNYTAFDGVAQYRTYDPSYSTEGINIDSGAVAPGEPPLSPTVGAGTKAAAEKLKGGDLTKLSGNAQKDIVTQKVDVPLQAFIDAHADTTGRAKVSQELRQMAFAKAAANPTDPASANVISKIDKHGNWIT